MKNNDHYDRAVQVRTGADETYFEVDTAALGRFFRALLDDGRPGAEVRLPLHGKRYVRVSVPDAMAGDLNGSLCKRLTEAGFEVDLPV